MRLSTCPHADHSVHQLVLTLHDRRTFHGGFDLWEAGPETIQAAFYFGSPDQAAPASIEAAMIVQSSAVLSMSKCANAGGACNFDSVFSEVQSFAEVAVSDPCNPNKNCSACIGASSPSLCLWLSALFCCTLVLLVQGAVPAFCAAYLHSVLCASVFVPFSSRKLSIQASYSGFL